VRGRSDRAVARAGSSGEIVGRGRGARWPWLIVVVAAGALKADAYASLLEHRAALISALAAALVASVIRQRPKPLLIAALSAALLASALALHPAVIGVAVGVGAFVLLVALFFAISTVLHARQSRADRGRRA
jgi:uncharacterized membrane protein YhhN